MGQCKENSQQQSDGSSQAETGSVNSDIHRVQCKWLGCPYTELLECVRRRKEGR